VLLLLLLLLLLWVRNGFVLCALWWCRDVLQFADADEAEAVYSMVSLTQARAPGWLPQEPAVQVEVGTQPAFALHPAGRLLWVLLHV